MKRSFAFVLVLVAVGATTGCNRSHGPGLTGAATPVLSILPSGENASADDESPEQLGDHEFQPTESPADGNSPFANGLLALPVVSLLETADGETRLRLDGVVGLESLREQLDESGELRAVVLEAGDLKLLALEGRELAIRCGTHQDSLDTQQVLRRIGGEFSAPLLAPRIPLPGPMSHALPPFSDTGMHHPVPVPAMLPPHSSPPFGTEAARQEPLTQASGDSGSGVMAPNAGGSEARTIPVSERREPTPRPGN